MTYNVVGIFPSADDAHHAVQDLLSEGFQREEISIVAKGEQPHHPETDGNLAGQGAATGAVSGAVVGGVLGVLLGVGAAFFPPAGVLIAGPAALAIAGVASGAATGGLIGGLVGMGIPHDQASAYAGEIEAGRVLVSTPATEDMVQRIAVTMDRYGEVTIDGVPLSTFVGPDGEEPVFRAGGMREVETAAEERQIEHGVPPKGIPTPDPDKKIDYAQDPFHMRVE